MKRVILLILCGAVAWAGQPFEAVATFYGKHYAGRKTAAGAHQVRMVPRQHWRFDPQSFTCASATLALGSIVRVSWLDRWVYVMCTDRMPGPGIDLSERAFAELAPLRIGTLFVQVQELP